MKVAFRNSFLRDLKKVKDQSILDRVRIVIIQVESASNLGKIANLKKISGADTFFRIRVGAPACRPVPRP